MSTSPSLQDFLGAPAPRKLPERLSGELEYVLVRQSNRLIGLVAICGLLPLGFAIPLGARAGGWIGAVVGALLAAGLAVAAGSLIHGLLQAGKRRLLERAESRQARVVRMDRTTVETDSVLGRVAAYALVVSYTSGDDEPEQRGVIIHERDWRAGRAPAVGDPAVVLVPQRPGPLRHVAIGGRLVQSATEEPYVWFK